VVGLSNDCGFFSSVIYYFFSCTSLDWSVAERIRARRELGVLWREMIDDAVVVAGEESQ